MDVLYKLDAQNGQPQIMITKSGLVSVIGESRPEDGRLFYDNVLEEIRAKSFQDLKIVFYLDYVSSSSTLSIIKFLKEVVQVGFSSLEIVWEYDEEDDGIKELGELFISEKQIPITLRVNK
jgi:hypothetical protein